MSIAYDLNDSDKNFQTVNMSKTFPSMDDYKGAQLVCEGRLKNDSDSSVNIGDLEMENRIGMSTSNQTNVESSVILTNFGVNEPSDDGEIIDVPAQGTDIPEPVKSSCQQPATVSTTVTTTVLVEPQSLGESN